jgi:tetratricopeptide (TPR) repeat protein
MSSTPHRELAERYFVDDLPGASRPGARLYGILERIDSGQTISAIAQSFLEQTGLRALCELASGEIDLGMFGSRAAPERLARTKAARLKEESDAAESARKAAAMDAAIKARFQAMENDPALRRKREAKELRGRYGLGFVEPEHYPRVIKLLKQVDGGKRMDAADIAWLMTESVDCWTDEIREVYHRLEAEALAEEWRRNGDLWAAVNASGHWRKADKPLESLKITDEGLKRIGSAPKLRSALCTTRGGAMRDLGRLAEAEAMGRDAHDLAPKDFRPCTLLGALAMQRGDFQSGQEWYQKAEGLGADLHAIDQDLRSVMVSAASEVREGLCAFLLSQDPKRYAWARRWIGSSDPDGKHAIKGDKRTAHGTAKHKRLRE